MKYIFGVAYTFLGTTMWLTDYRMDTAAFQSFIISMLGVMFVLMAGDKAE